MESLLVYSGRGVKFDTFFVQADRGKWFRNGGGYGVDYGAFDL